MSETKQLTIDQGHHYFGVFYNNNLWTFLEKETLTEEDKEQAVHYAHAAMIHWQMYSACKIVNQQRGSYMLARTYIIVGDAQNGLKYAQKCLNITLNNLSEMKDFDVAYAHEIMARAAAQNQSPTLFNEHYSQAQKAGNAIKDVEDKKIFDGDMQAKPWFGMV